MSTKKLKTFPKHHGLYTFERKFNKYLGNKALDKDLGNKGQNQRTDPMSSLILILTYGIEIFFKKHWK